MLNEGEECKHVVSGKIKMDNCPKFLLSTFMQASRWNSSWSDREIYLHQRIISQDDRVD